MMEATQLHKLKQLYTAELAWMKKAPSGRQTKKVNRIEDFHAIKEDFKQKKVSNYDLYLTKNDKQVIGFFTYSLKSEKPVNSLFQVDRNNVFAKSQRYKVFDFINT